MIRGLAMALACVFATVGSAGVIPEYYDPHTGLRTVFPSGIRLSDEAKFEQLNNLCADSPVSGAVVWCPNCARTNPASLCQAPPCGAFCYRQVGAVSNLVEWDCGNTGGCLPPQQPCINNIDCCSTDCMNGFCTNGQCGPEGNFCNGNGDCCSGLLCISNLCTATTTTTTTTTSTSTAGVSTTTSSSTSSSTSTSTTLALSGSLALVPPLPGTIMNQELVGPAMVCGVLRMGFGVSANHLAAAFQSSGFCSVAIYPDNDAGSLIVSVTAPCPNPGVVTGTAPFTLAGGAQYRFCICTTGSSSAYKYLSFYNQFMTLLANTFSTSIGQSTNACNGGNGVPPGTTGALIKPSANTPLPLPFITVEQ